MIGNDEGSPTVLIVDLEAELLIQVHPCNDFEFRCEVRILTRFEAILLLKVSRVVKSTRSEVLMRESAYEHLDNNFWNGVRCRRQRIEPSIVKEALSVGRDYLYVSILLIAVESR